MIWRGDRSVGEKLERERGGRDAVQATRDHGLSDISHDRCDDWKILQIIRTGIAVAEVIGCPSIAGKIDIDDCIAEKTVGQNAVGVAKDLHSGVIEGYDVALPWLQPSHRGVTCRNDARSIAEGWTAVRIRSDQIAPNDHIVCVCTNANVIAGDNIPATQLSRANDAIERVNDSGAVSIALPQATGICSEVIASNCHRERRKNSRAISGDDVARCRDVAADEVVRAQLSQPKSRNCYR